MSNKRTTLIRQSGFYRVESHASGKLTVYPDWPQFQPVSEDAWIIGPGVFSRMDLAADIERFLNGGIRHPSRNEKAKEKK